MSKRVATPHEIKQMLAKEPWNGVQSTKLPYGIIRIKLTASQRQVPLTIYFSDTMLLDENKNPIFPLDGIAIPELARRINIPQVTADTKLLFGTLKTVDEGDVFDMTVQKDSVEHFMTITQHTYPTRCKDTSITQQPWAFIPLREFSHYGPIDSKDIDDNQVMQATSGIDQYGHYWVYTIYPIGYCVPEHTLDGRYRITDANGRECIESTPEALFPAMANTARRLYWVTYDNLGQKMDNKAESITAKRAELQSFCNTFHERVLALQAIEGFGYLNSSFTLYSDNERILSGSKICTVDSIARWLTRIERKAALYQVFRPQFEALRAKIEDAYGQLSTDDPYYAEVIFPVHSYAEKDPGNTARRFHYSVVGYADLLQWLDQQEELIRKAEGQIKQFGKA